MKWLLVAGLIVLLVSTAHAGSNPDVRIYIDFDPPNYVHGVAPEPYEMFDAYVCMDQVGGGVMTVSFRVTDLMLEYPGMVGTQSWTQLFPGQLPICWPWSDWGSTIYSEECMTEEEGPVLVGYLSYFYLGYGSGCLEILDHADYPRWVVDCGEPGEVDLYCVLAHGSINGGACPDGDCPAVPVADGTWGTIKSMYR